MSRKIIEKRAREIIIQVDNYFVKEREDTKLLLENVSRSLRATLIETSENVVMSRQLVKQILTHLQNTTKVTERVMSATGIAKNTVTKLRREKIIAMASGSRIRTPVKKARRKMDFLDGFSLSGLRNIITDMYAVRKEIPTMRKIMAAAKQNFDYKGSETTLRQIMKNDLGYRFKKCYKKRLALIERPNIQAWRAKYLRRMKENDSLGANRKTVIYIGETWTHAQYTAKKYWQSDTDVGQKKNDCPGRRWVVVHAGNESGFVANALLMFKSNSKIGDYQIISENFRKWLEEQLIPNIPPNCIIVMDNDPCHNKEEYRSPNMSSKTQAMVEWLQAHNIKFPEYYTKSELYMMIKNHQEPKKYVVDKLLADHGHEVVRLPPCSCDLNPIEYIFKIVKQRVSEENVKQLDSQIESITLQAIESITPDDWENKVNHVKNLEVEYWNKDRLVDDLFVTNTGNDSETDTTDSETNSESNSDCMSGIEDDEVVLGK